MTEGRSHEESREHPDRVERAIEHVEHAKADLADAEAKELRAEHELGEAIEELERAEHEHAYELIINRKPHTWPCEEITGSEIKKLADSPPDWVVNQIVEGPREDPEIGDNQVVHLARDAEPEGVKRFTTRKPKTSPGA
jgi:Multiubiquitin